jgi:hypothetical protein
LGLTAALLIAAVAVSTNFGAGSSGSAVKTSPIVAQQAAPGKASAETQHVTVHRHRPGRAIPGSHITVVRPAPVAPSAPAPASGNRASNVGGFNSGGFNSGGGYYEQDDEGGSGDD